MIECRQERACCLPGLCQVGPPATRAEEEADRQQGQERERQEAQGADEVWPGLQGATVPLSTERAFRNTQLTMPSNNLTRPRSCSSRRPSLRTSFRSLRRMPRSRRQSSRRPPPTRSLPSRHPHPQRRRPRSVSRSRPRHRASISRRRRRRLRPRAGARWSSRTSRRLIQTSGTVPFRPVRRRRPRRRPRWLARPVPVA